LAVLAGDFVTAASDQTAHSWVEWLNYRCRWVCG
jgi:hypothetical protein